MCAYIFRYQFSATVIDGDALDDGNADDDDNNDESDDDDDDDEDEGLYIYEYMLCVVFCVDSLCVIKT